MFDGFYHYLSAFRERPSYHQRIPDIAKDIKIYMAESKADRARKRWAQEDLDAACGLKRAYEGEESGPKENKSDKLV